MLYMFFNAKTNEEPVFAKYRLLSSDHWWRFIAHLVKITKEKNGYIFYL